MSLEITFLPAGLVGLFAALIAWAAAAFVFLQVPDRRIATRFSILLVVEGFMILSSWAGPMVWLSDLEQARTAAWFHIVNDSLLVAAYLPAIAVIVDSRMVQVFARLPAMLLPLGIGLCGAVAAIAFPEAFLGARESVVPGPENLAAFFYQGGALWPLVFLFLTLSYSYGLIATIRAWWRADSPVARRKNGVLALAFGTRDLVWGGMFLTGVMQAALGMEPDPVITVLGVHVGAVALIIYVLLTAYGIASAQLFDIDLKLKWTLQRGTVAAAYLAFYFVASEGTASFLSDQIGTVVGLLVTGLLVFAVAPINRLAERLSDRAMPNVQDTEEYRIFRKLEIYGEAYAGAVEAGEIGAVRRAALNRLRARLELTAEDVESLEAELASA